MSACRLSFLPGGVIGSSPVASLKPSTTNHGPARSFVRAIDQSGVGAHLSRCGATTDTTVVGFSDGEPPFAVSPVPCHVKEVPYAPHVLIAAITSGIPSHLCRVTASTIRLWNGAGRLMTRCQRQHSSASATRVINYPERIPAMPRGMQSVNIDVICTSRLDERAELVSHFLSDSYMSAEEQRILDRFDQGTMRLEQAVQCLWIARAWMTALTPDGNRRTHDLEAQYHETYGAASLELAAD